MPRTSCCVPFCRCTTAKHYSEWICAKHWKLARPVEKRVHSRAKRRVRRMIAAERFDLVDKYVTVANRVWDRIKKRVIERVVGLT